MSSFDFTDASLQGYKFFWHNRQVIARLAFGPFIIKLLALSLVVAFGLENQYLRQGLILLPSYFAEGWLVTTLIRLAILDEKPIAIKRFLPAASLTPPVLSGAIIFTLIKLTLVLITAAFMHQNEIQNSKTPITDPDGFALFTAFMLLGIIIWGFRFLWLYIPAALDDPLVTFLTKIKGFMSSVYMIAVWLLCFVPMATLLLFFMQLLSNFFDNADNIYFLYSSMFLQTIIELIISVISSVAMAYGLYALHRGAS